MISKSPIDVRVVKLGGSLLDFDQLVIVWSRWLYCVVAGGQRGDRRRWPIGRSNSCDGRRERLGRQEAAHWLSVRAMGYTAANVASILPDVELVDRLTELDLTKAATTIFDVWHFLFEDDRFTEHPLPCSWQVDQRFDRSRRESPSV